MTDAELRALAVRVVAETDAEVAKGYGLTHEERAANLLGKAYLAEHPADDAEFLTGEWLLSRGARSPQREPFTFEFDGFTLDWFSGSDQGSWELTIGNTVFPNFNTRGQVRRLSAALGRPLTEPTPEG